MSDVTKVGPPEPDDLPRKPNSFFERIWRRSLFAGLFNFSLGFGGPLAIFKTREMEQRVEAEEQAEVEADHPWHGLPEAELTDEQRREAMERLSRE